MDFIRDEVKDYKEISKRYKEQFGADSNEYKLAEAKYKAVWMLANDIGVADIW